MTKQFEFTTATRVFFGLGALGRAFPLAAEFGRGALVVTGRRTERATPLLKLLATHQIDFRIFKTGGEPTTEMVRLGSLEARQMRLSFVIAMGGGSAIDAGKAIAALMTNPGDVLDYLEVVGRGQPLTLPSAPFIAIPTTAGTGAEVTRNAVLASAEHGVKASLRSPLMLPRLAIVDPELTLDLPSAITATTGLDALTQLIEPFVSARANPLTDALCRDGIARVARSLRRAFEQPTDIHAREDMALASLFGGMALANAGLGAVHGFAAPIGGMFAAPHGAVCAALLPHVMEVNIRALRERSPKDEALRRFEEVARIVTGRPEAKPDDGVQWVAGLCATLQIPPLRRHGVTEKALPAIAEKAAIASSMKGNPISLTPGELDEVLHRAW